ncbi:MAG: hypothetical protein Q4A88_02590 [Clostridia bacterium]|nr:hypothetical protein [Clostridia bacterium]
MTGKQLLFIGAIWLVCGLIVLLLFQNLLSGGLMTLVGVALLGWGIYQVARAKRLDKRA